MVLSMDISSIYGVTRETPFSTGSMKTLHYSAHLLFLGSKHLENFTKWYYAFKNAN